MDGWVWKKIYTYIISSSSVYMFRIRGDEITRWVLKMDQIIYLFIFWIWGDENYPRGIKIDQKGYKPLYEFCRLCAIPIEIVPRHSLIARLRRKAIGIKLIRLRSGPSKKISGISSALLRNEKPAPSIFKR